VRKVKPMPKSAKEVLYGRHLAPEAWPVCYERGWTIVEIADYFCSSCYMVRRKLDRANTRLRGESKVLDYKAAPRLTKEQRAAVAAEREKTR
jgi:hypothetical protein